MRQVAGADHGLADRGQRSLGCEQRLDRKPLAFLWRALGEHLREAELAGDLGAGTPADGLVEDLGELADVGVRMLVEEERGDREAEDAVAQERETTVGRG